MRHPSRFKIGERECVGAEPVTLRFGEGLGAVLLPDQHLVLTMPPELDAFAAFDGFGDFDGMRKFWMTERRPGPGSSTVFEGWHIRWLPLPVKEGKPWTRP